MSAVTRRRGRHVAVPGPEPLAPGESWAIEVVGDLAGPVDIVPPDTRVTELDERFRHDTSLLCVVVDTDRGPVVVGQAWFQAHMAGPMGYGRALTSRRSLRDLRLPPSLRFPADTGIVTAAAAMVGPQEAAFGDIAAVLWPSGEIGVVTAVDLFEQLAGHYAFQAMHDSLTRLPNRLFLMQVLQQARVAGEDVALMYVDLDRFKDVNDHYGHTAGDQVLVQFAERLRALAGRDGVAARLGGDEFALLLRGRAADREVLAERVVQDAAAPFAVRLGRDDAGHEQQLLVTIGASVGVAQAGGAEIRYTSADLMLKHADLAMYRAKTRGRSRVAHFHTDLLLGIGGADQMHARHRLERRLRAAIHAGGLHVHYQPLVSLPSGRVLGVEALARWHDDELGDVPPTEFVAVAEDTGLVLDLGRWVLRAACAQAATWPGGFDGRVPIVAVNVSAVQLAEPTFTDDVVGALEASGLPADRLSLEITETAAIEDVDETARRLQRLRDLGVRIALDDFGTGHASLRMLRRLPVHVVKIDRSFVAGVASDPADAVLVRLVVDAAHALGISVCAEGIEDLEQARHLLAMGCDTAQGWLFGRPQAVTPALLPFLMHGGAVSSALKGASAQDTVTSIYR
jgi:diguanylate cyclase (GGDEF)-like protein